MIKPYTVGFKSHSLRQPLRTSSYDSSATFLPADERRLLPILITGPVASLGLEMAVTMQTFPAMQEFACRVPLVY